MGRIQEYATTRLEAEPEERPAVVRADDKAFRIAILGDFSGRANRRVPSEPRLRSRKPVAIDLDNFDDVMRRMAAELVLPGPDAPVALRLQSLDDFHPDALYEDLPLFHELRRLRQELLDERPAARAPRAAPRDPLPSALGSGSLLDDIVSGAEGPAAARPAADPWQRTIEDIVAPHLERQPGARQAELAGSINEAMHLAMRVLLHHPDFQDLEAAWRSIDFLLRRLEAGSELKISLIDVSKQELLDDMAAGAIDESGLHRLLVDEPSMAGETPWAVVAGLYTFEPTMADIRALGRIASIAEAAGAPFLAAASPHLMGCESFGAQADPAEWNLPVDAEAEAEWTKLRALPEARWIGLALPRWLLREPYGKGSTDLAEFAEVSAPPDHADLLWANSAVACVYLIGESFLRDGWEIALRGVEIGGLPLHTYKMDGESLMTPCAECWMSERAAGRIVERGLMPLASMKGRDAVRLVRLQSIGTPQSGLRARWN